MSFKFVFSVFLVLVVAGFLPNVFAYDNSVFARWPSYPNVQFYVDGSCSMLVNGPKGNFVDQSLQEWVVGFNFHYTFTNDGTRGSNKMFLYCTSGQGAGTPPWDTGMAAACESEFHGGCTSWSYRNDGLINGLPVFNYTWAWVLIGPYINIALPHELGHMLGMAHSVRPQDLMYAGTQCFDYCRETAPSQDDFSVLNNAYAQPVPEFSNVNVSVFAITLLFASAVLVVHRRKQQ